MKRDLNLGSLLTAIGCFISCLYCLFQVSGISNYFEREVKRRSFVVMRWDFRENEKREIEQEHKRKAGVSSEGIKMI